MSASKSSYLRTKMIEAALKAVAFTGPATIYIAFHTAAPGLTGANEVAGNAYARTAVAFGASASGVVLNSSSPTTPAPTPANWGTLTHFSLWDAASAGNMLYADALNNPVATSVGVPVNIPVGSLSVAET